MLIRVKGYNTGAKEYLEEGTKAGRDYTRDELDQRVILDGDLDITKMVYDSIPDKGQDRYLSFTMAFREDDVSVDTLNAVTQEFKSFMMYAYREDEFNFYAEAHLPKIKTITDKKTGEQIDRKPHIHILIPKKNLLSGNIFDPVGSSYSQSEKHLEAFQEYINQKYKLASPREHVRADIADAASVLSRYKGDDFYGKNREFKQSLVKEVIGRNITTRQDFYSLVAEFGETRVRNEGKPTEYIGVRLGSDAKFTNLKETIFQDHFIVNRDLKKASLDPRIIDQRLAEWPQRSKEIKYISKAGPDFRKLYVSASTEERAALLASTEKSFYQTYGDRYVIHPKQRKRDLQRSAVEAGTARVGQLADGLQNLPGRTLADNGQGEPAGARSGSLLLPSDARLHMGRQDSGRDLGLRTPLRRGRGRERSPASFGRRTSTVPQGAARSRAGEIDRTNDQSGSSGRATVGSRSTRRLDLPPHAQNPRRIPSVSDIQARTDRLFGRTESQEAVISPGKSSTAPRGPRRRRSNRSSSRDFSAASRDLRRISTIADIEARSDQLFDRADSAGQERKDRQPTGGKRRNPGRRSTRIKAVPPYARNPNKVPSLADIAARTERLFGSSSIAAGNSTQIKRVSIKSLTAGRSASTVAAYLKRQVAADQLKPAQRQQIRRINNQYFATRRALFADPRLTREDKAQLAAVLTFERMKANIEVMTSTNGKGINSMASADIRNLIDDDVDETGFSISGARGPEPTPVRDRVKRIVDRVGDYLDPKPAAADERLLGAKDLYTKKARFSQNIHYLDKQTDKTLFVDTGKTIAMRRTGITEAGVSVALQLAKERFGSTLTINGSSEFKTLVIEAAAKNGLDIHFTDKAMNESLAARRVELEIGESEAQITAAPKDVHPGVAAWSDAGQEQLRSALTERLEVTSLAGEHVASLDAPEGGWTKESMVEQLTAQLSAKTFADGFDALLGGNWVASTDPQREAALTVEASLKQAASAEPGIDAESATESLFDVEREAKWRAVMGLSEADVLASKEHMASRGSEHAIWLIADPRAPADALDLVRAYLQNDSYRQSFKSTVEELYKSFSDSPELIEALDKNTALHTTLVHEVEDALHTAPERADPAADQEIGRTGPVASKEGILISYGPAPYQHDAKNRESYFVTLDTANGPKTYWGVGLEDAMLHEGKTFAVGDTIQLRDLGTSPVTITVVNEAGEQEPVVVNRRTWSAEVVTTSADKTTVQHDESGPTMD